jgi:AraC-like DNA-binding protein
MSFEFSLYSTPLLFGFVQGWIYAILLWWRAKRDERLSDFLLGWVLVGCCFNIWEYMLGFGGIEILWRQLEFVPRNLGLLFAPLCYFYLKSQFNSNFRFERRHLWHALPFLLEVTYHLLVFAQGPEFVRQWQQNVHWAYHIDDFVFVFGLGWSLYYLWQSLKLYQQYRAWTETQFSDTEGVSFRWFRHFIIALASMLLFSFVMTILDIWLNLDFWHDWWDELFGVALIYYLSINGYAQHQSHKLLFSPVAEVVNIPDTTPKITLPVADYAVWKNKIERVFEEEKLYLQPELTLSDLATRLRTNTSVLSAAINQNFDKNFNDFVNQYRVEEVKRQLKNPDNAHLSLLGIALECGFNSKSTFNRAFKKFTGQSPKEFV